MHVDLPVALPWAAFALTWIGIGLLAAGVHRVLQKPLSTTEPAQRSMILFALALLPLTVALLVAMLGFIPHFGGLIVDQHCHAGTGCESHVPVITTGFPIAAAWTLLIVAGTAGAGWLLAKLLLRSVAVGRMLDAFAGSKLAAGSGARQHDGNAPVAYKVIDSPAVFACCTGLIRTQVLVSSGLLDRLSSSELDAVLAHERVHAQRRDNLRRLLVSLSLWPVLRRWRAGLVKDLEAATESACDRAAARALGSADAVAAAIRSVARHSTGGMAFRHPGAAVLSEESATALDARVALIDSGGLVQLPRLLVIATVVVAYAVTAIVTTRLAHHVAEFFII